MYTIKFDEFSFHFKVKTCIEITVLRLSCVDVRFICFLFPDLHRCFGLFIRRRNHVKVVDFPVSFRN